MSPPGRNATMHTYHLCFLILASTATLSAAVTASPYSSACPSLAPAHDRHTDGDDAVSLIRSFRISAGQFSGGADGLFSPDDDPSDHRPFHLFPHRASRTDEPTLVHLTATLTVIGPRSWRSGGRHYYSEAASIAFVLDGYHSSASLELCMVGTGTEHAADGSLKLYPDVVLRLHVPSPPSLGDPFVSGSIEGSSDLGTIRLLAYAEGDHYKYDSERAACSPGPSRQLASSSLRALGGVNSVCAHLKEHLMISYRLEHGGATLTWMRINQMQCSADGATVRAYAVLLNDTGPDEGDSRRRRFLVGEEALVADGHWDQARRMLCLRACRVTLPTPTSAPVVREHDCGIGMSFWFPAVWTMRDRNVVAGMLWNSSHADAEAEPIHGVMTERSTTNLSDVKYNYNDTILEEAKKHHREFSKGKKMRGSHSFPDFNSTNGDSEFIFHGLDIRSGQAYAVTIGSAIVASNVLAADDFFSQQWVLYGSTRAATSVLVDDMKADLLNVSYVIRYSTPRDKSRVRLSNVADYSNYSNSFEKRKILAEGVYDRKRGIMCMVGCQEHNGSTDCETLVTVQFTSLDSKEQEHGTGAISSLRDKTDPLFFKRIDFILHGMYSSKAGKAISRMDMESVMIVASTTLSCVFTIQQILHTKRNPEVAPATSVTMLAVLTMGYLAPLVLNSEALFTSRRSDYHDSYPTSRRLEMKEVMMRVPTLIAFLLQLRLLQLAWFGRRTSTMSEKTVLWICLPLYALGGVVAAVVHVINVRASVRNGPLAMNMGGWPAMMWQDLVSYAGLIVDGFLLPQVIFNASLGESRARAISPWFYTGGTMLRLMPHVYDVVRAQIYKPSIRSSNLYASPRDDLFGGAWDAVIACGAALLALLLFLQQRLPATASLPSQRRRSAGYEMVSNI